MTAPTNLLQFFLLGVSGWWQRHQVAAIEYFKAENRLLRKRLGERRVLFSDAERRELAKKARALGRKGLGNMDTSVTPDTLLRWHRELVARKSTIVERRKPGRPRTRNVILELIVRMATENSGWGYTRIPGALANLKYMLARGTVRNILKEQGIEPAPMRVKHMPWSVFLKAHWKALVVSDFFSVEV
jgi:putative transposase